MRPYLAVIKDSFREALASRVLWVLLVLITLLLLALWPLAVRREIASSLGPADIRDFFGFARKLAEQGQAAAPSPGKQIFQQLPDDTQRRLGELDDASGRRIARMRFALVGELNDLIGQKDFYNAEAWRRYPLGGEAEELAKRGTDSLSEAELRRFNRLALDTAFPEEIAPVAGEQSRLVYFGLEIGDPLPFDRENIQTQVKFILAVVMSLFVGVLGVFVAILVTASIIPQMFEPGAIDLLLSRPLSRSLLFLSKFVGGCIFILLNAAYLICGLWLYVGVRFDIWSGKLLLCIPVFLFLFAIYYSISALAGVIWRNAVVSVVMTILFWAACFTVGTSKGVIETMFLNPRRLAMVIPAGETLLATNKTGETFEWQSSTSQWRPVFTSSQGNVPFGFAYPMVGPIYDAEGDQLVAIQSAAPGIPGSSGAGKLVVGKRAEDWRRIMGVSAPVGIHGLFVAPDGQIVIAGTSGVYRFEGDPSQEHKPQIWLGIDWSPPSKTGKFVEAGPEGHGAWSLPYAVGRDPSDGRLAVFSRGTLAILQHDADGKYAIAGDVDLETKEPAVIGFAGGKVLLAWGNGDIQVFDGESLEREQQFLPFGNEKPRQVAAAPNGRWFAVLYHNGKLALIDARAGELAARDIAGQGNISAVAFDAENHLFVADRYPRVIEYDLETERELGRFEAASDTLELIYRYFVNPVYTVFPKPGELDNVINYLLIEEKTVSPQRDDQDLQSERVVVDIWQPVWSNLIFLVVVLGLTCLYIERRDF